MTEEHRPSEAIEAEIETVTAADKKNPRLVGTLRRELNESLKFEKAALELALAQNDDAVSEGELRARTAIALVTAYFTKHETNTAYIPSLTAAADRYHDAVAAIIKGGDSETTLAKLAVQEKEATRLAHENAQLRTDMESLTKRNVELTQRCEAHRVPI